ncbi:hypothetical protein [Bacillus sp. REN3]|nr:hypothetical protein [Bacillus sp. REN3]
MKQPKRKGNLPKPRKGVTTRFVGKTKMEIENEKASEIIRAFKGSFG